MRRKFTCIDCPNLLSGKMVHYLNGKQAVEYIVKCTKADGFYLSQWYDAPDLKMNGRLDGIVKKFDRMMEERIEGGWNDCAMLAERMLDEWNR